MSERLPSLRALAVIRALERGGFEVVRSAGSHHRLVHKQDPPAGNDGLGSQGP